ncbi:MAG: hypothetical protein OXU61_00725, partial [Gammaproteobacteria bacterium]|nr:hypothetical protein [Gammaproteobacteria bacterium]
RFIRWIPACAGMARWGHGNGGVGFIRWMPTAFLHRLFRRNDTRGGRNDRALFPHFQKSEWFLHGLLHGNGGFLPCLWVVFRAALDFRGFYTAWKGGIQLLRRCGFRAAPAAHP